MNKLNAPGNVKCELRKWTKEPVTAHLENALTPKSHLNAAGQMLERHHRANLAGMG